VIGKAFRKLVFGLRTKLHEAGKDYDLMAGGRRVEYMRAGDGQPLLYLHSLVGETRWLPFHQHLARHYDVVAPAHPGFGGTEGIDDMDTMEDLVFHYLDFMEAAGLQRPVLVGVSLGGWIAAEFAVRYPERISRLVLADPFGLWLDDEPIPDFFASLEDSRELRRLLFADPQGHIAELVVPSRETDQERFLAGYAAMSAAAKWGWNPFMHDPKLRGRLHRISCPTLLLWGDSDPLLSVAYAESWRDSIAGAELRVLRRCGHLPQLEQGDAFAREVVAFG
jgi:pimeloyl-ACP methyl ester carboxylesterase